MVGGFFFLLHPIALMAWLILSQVLWQELMALSLLPLWGCVGWPQQMTNFLGVNYNLFVINPGTDSMTTTQTVTQSRLNPLDRGKPLVQRVASNCCPQAGLCGCAGGYHASLPACLSHLWACVHHVLKPHPWTFNVLLLSPQWGQFHSLTHLHSTHITFPTLSFSQSLGKGGPH